MPRSFLVKKKPEKWTKHTLDERKHKGRIRFLNALVKVTSG